MSSRGMTVAVAFFTTYFVIGLEVARFHAW